MRSDDEIRADVRIADGNNYERYEQDAADGRLVGDVPDLLAEVVRLRAAADAVKALHSGWHVCVNADGHGAQDWCDDEDGMGPCPTVAALAGGSDA